MRRVVVVGATGHIGSYLVPRLVRGGYEVIAVSRGIRGPYLQSPQWDSVTTVTVDRAAADAEGSFGAQVAALRPMPRPPASTPSAASPRALPGPGRGLGMRRGSARWRPSTRHWPGSSPMGRWTAAAR